MKLRRCSALVALVAATFAYVDRARAADDNDGSHGRVEGDLGIEVGVGASFGPTAPRAAGDLRLRYLSTAGIFGTYEDGPLIGSESEPLRVIAMGLELRPLFLGKWFTGRYTGVPHVDLALDSFGLELGAVFVEPQGARFGSRPGLQAGIGVELPIFPRATGPFIALHGGARWSDAALSGGPLFGPSDRSLYLNVIIAWQQIFGGATVMDAGERAP